MEAETRPAVRVTAKEIRAIEEIIRRRNQAEIKVEQGQVVVIELRRKKVNGLFGKERRTFRGRATPNGIICDCSREQRTAEGLLIPEMVLEALLFYTAA